MNAFNGAGIWTATWHQQGHDRPGVCAPAHFANSPLAGPFGDPTKAQLAGTRNVRELELREISGKVRVIAEAAKGLGPGRRTVRLLLAVLMATAALHGQQPALHIDLSGPWRMQAGDDAAYAQPGFDDSSWSTVNAPFPWERPVGFLWLRRSVGLPEWLNNDTPLVLSTGAFTPVFEIFINGHRVGGAGAPTIFETYVPRPRSFVLPASFGQPGARLTIAIRAWRPNGFWPVVVDVNAPFPDTGPWVLTGAMNAPRVDDRQVLGYRESRARLMTLSWGFSMVLVVLVLFAWTFQRERREQLYFCGYMLTEAVLNSSGWGLLLWDWPFAMLSWSSIALETSPLFLSLFFRGTLPGLWRWTPAVVAIPTLWVGGLNYYNLAVRSAEFPLKLYQLTLPFDVLATALMFIGSVRSARTLHRQGERGAAGIAVVAGVVALTSNPEFRMQIGMMLNLVPFSVSVRTIFALWVTLRVLAGLGAARQRLAGEMEAARTVQTLLLPASLPGHIDAAYLPAQEVGGDFWHWLDDRLLVVGDVSGKGLKAAMIVSLVTGALRNRRSDSPAVLLSELNGVLTGNAGFVTCCIVRFAGDGRITVANAGHPAPYVDGRELELPAGLPLGIMAGAEYVETEVEFHGQLTLVSDGVVEAANSRGELFGFDRTQEISGKAARIIADAAKTWGQNDDITVVTVRGNA